jgi:hypothetical protein
MRRLLIGSFTLAVIWGVTGVALGWHLELHAFDHFRVKFFLTLICLMVGSWLTGIQLEAMATYPRLTRIGFVAIAVSQVAFLLLVWTTWKSETPLWRIWWISMVGSVTTTHIIVLMSRSVEHGQRTARGTVACALVACCLMIGLALRPDILATPSPIEIFAWLLPAVGSVVGTVVLWYRTSERLAMPRSRWWVLTWVPLCFFGTFWFGFYAGRVTTSPPSLVEGLPTNLTELTPEQLDAQLRTDLTRLKAVAASLDGLMKKHAELRKALQDKRVAEKRQAFLPGEDADLRAQFMSYLACRAALLRMVATYSGFAAVGDGPARGRCFLVGFCAGTTLIDTSRQLIQDYQDDPVARAKLNEADINWGIRAGMFDRIYDNSINERNLEVCDEMAAYYQLHAPDWRSAEVFAADDLDWLTGRIAQGLAGVSKNRVGPVQVQFDRLMKRVKQDTYKPVYATQSLVSIWIGDTRLMRRPPFITHDDIKSMKPKLMAGDIILERRNWFLSNSFLPGFWPHAALYVGGIDDLEKIGVVRRGNGKWESDHKEVSKRLPEFLKKAPDGHAHDVIESVSEGVIFNSVFESLHADYVAILRPRVSDKEKAAAIVKAFSHQGKPYDFEFDFKTEDKLVCTELVYRSYQNPLNFKLQHIMGRDTLPAVEIGRTFARDPKGQLEFLFFLDAVPGENRCRFASADDFCKSCERSRGFNE